MVNVKVVHKDINSFPLYYSRDIGLGVAKKVLLKKKRITSTVLYNVLKILRRITPRLHEIVQNE